MSAAALRLAAVAIAFIAILDPAITISAVPRAQIAVFTSGSPSPAVLEARTRVVERIAASFEPVAHITSDTAAAVVVGDRYPNGPVPPDLPVATVTVADDVQQPARIIRVDAPREVPRGTAIGVAVVAEAGAGGIQSDVVVRIGGLEVGRASHRWATEGERWRAVLDVVPVGEPPWVVQASVLPQAAAVGATTASTATVVDQRRAPLRVTFYEPRPSWATTFMRRALEGDNRFDVESVTFSSRGVAVRTGQPVQLADERIDEREVIVVGGLDRLAQSDVRALDRFMRERGGAVVLAPDAPVNAGMARELLPFTVAERLLERPARLSTLEGLAPLQASELLIATGLAAAEIVAHTGTAEPTPVIVSVPRGAGRLLVSGAMDAWRFRSSDDAGFDRFWRAVIAGLAQSVPSPIDITVDPPLLRPLQRGEVTVRVRSQEYAPLVASVDGEFVRLVPEARRGVWRGTFVAAPHDGVSTIEIRPSPASPPSASRIVVVRADARVSSTALPLAVLASAHRGVNVTPDRIGELERFLSAAVATRPTPRVTRPMRSAWWIVPFVTCLCCEWWLRRRRGLR